MLTQGRFLISYQVFDNIPVNNNGQTHVREILKDTQAFTFSYRTEQIRDYLRYPGEELIPEHLHMINALKEILELISGLDYIGNLPTVPDLEKPIEIQVSTTRQIPLEQNKEVQTKIKEIIYNNLYDTLIDELKSTISRFQAQYNIQEINPYLQDILQNPEDLVSLSQHHKR